MKTPSFDITLMALLLALKNLEEPLSELEQSKLFDIGEQLETDLTKWHSTQNDLMAVISANAFLKKLYESFITDIYSVKYDALFSKLVTEKELEQELPQESYLQVRGHFAGQPDLQSNEILNVIIVVLKTKDPVAAIQKLSFIDRILKSIRDDLTSGNISDI
jgi:hypothetical protein